MHFNLSIRHDIESKLSFDVESKLSFELQSFTTDKLIKYAAKVGSKMFFNNYSNYREENPEYLAVATWWSTFTTKPVFFKGRSYEYSPRNTYVTKLWPTKTIAVTKANKVKFCSKLLAITLQSLQLKNVVVNIQFKKAKPAPNLWK